MFYVIDNSHSNRSIDLLIYRSIDLFYRKTSTVSVKKSCSCSFCTIITTQLFLQVTLELTTFLRNLIFVLVNFGKFFMTFQCKYLCVNTFSVNTCYGKNIHIIYHNEVNFYHASLKCQLILVFKLYNFFRIIYVIYDGLKSNNKIRAISYVFVLKPVK